MHIIYFMIFHDNLLPYFKNMLTAATFEALHGNHCYFRHSLYRQYCFPNADIRRSISVPTFISINAKLSISLFVCVNIFILKVTLLYLLHFDSIIIYTHKNAPCFDRIEIIHAPHSEFVTFSRSVSNSLTLL